MKRAVVLACLGLTGSLLVAVSAPRLFAGGEAITWWFSSAFSSGRTANSIALYAGMLILAGAWLALGTCARARIVAPSTLCVIGGVWALPLLAGPPLFSHDVYSYLAQGTIAHLSHNPYH